jgi:hypothetical protein
MGSILESEGVKTLLGLAVKYKGFCFKAITQIPYKSVTQWIAFADNRVEDALQEKRSIGRNLKDTYVLAALGPLFSIMALWYLALIFGGIMGTTIFFILALAAVTNPVMTLLALVVIFIVLLIMPAIHLFIRTTLHYILAKITGGRGSYTDTMSIMVLGGGAQITLTIPMYIAYAVIVGFLVSPFRYVIWLYTFYLEYKAIKYVHSLSTKRAAAVVIGGFLITFLFWAGIWIVFYLIILAYKSKALGVY